MNRKGKEAIANHERYNKDNEKRLADVKGGKVKLQEEKKTEQLDEKQQLLARIGIEVYEFYLEELKDIYDVAEVKFENPDNRIYSFDITKWVVDKTENNFDKLLNVYQVISNEECNVALVYNRTSEKVTITLAISNISKEGDPNTSKKFVDRIYAALNGNFPGAVTTYGALKKGIPASLQNALYTTENGEGMGIKPGLNCAVVSNIATEKSEDFVSQSIEKLLDGFKPLNDGYSERAGQGNYTIILVASPDKHCQQKVNQLRTLYTILSPYAQVQRNEQTSNALNLTKGHNVGGNVGVSIAPVNLGVNYAYNASTTESFSTTEGETVTYTDYTVKNTLDHIEKQIQRLEQGEAMGFWQTAAYIFSEDLSTVSNVANIYRALTIGETSFLSKSTVNTWEADSEGEHNVRNLATALGYILHPEFVIQPEKNQMDEYQVYPSRIKATTYLSGKELAYALNMPQKSVSGVPVVESVAFGRDVFRNGSLADASGKGTICLGNIYHMKAVEQRRYVQLNVDSLTSHVFVTGSTGTGKSNVIYQLLQKVAQDDEKNVKFLVVEPAKGEYKHAFYKNSSFKNLRVYGTNPKKTELLKINPFSFPEDIHVYEHIDRLVEIFNVCWPMYAAMPAILKNAVIQSYKSCGWDLDNSEMKNGGEPVYPNFNDVLSQIENILNTSAFSSDNKGDYTGALCTRVESLSVGLNGMMFSGKEISNEELFNNNVIVDLSRVGSTETKSLIMGLLIMKLQEYRMSENKGMNLGLRHVTVLEEAHNLLKKTSTEQAAESSNLLGKSVEMLTNAIAEMRTYGESFVIADQAPALLDEAVIRNTNTKIVLRLPDYNDRILVGKSIGLDDSQIEELSKLELGVAAVYQNDWQEAVLCKFEKYYKNGAASEVDDQLYEYRGYVHIKSVTEFKLNLLRYLLSKVVDSSHQYTNEERRILLDELRSCNYSHEFQSLLEEMIQNGTYDSLETLSPIVGNLFEKIDLSKANMAENVDQWNRQVLWSIDPGLQALESWYMNVFIQCLLIEEAKENAEFIEHTKQWILCMKER